MSFVLGILTFVLVMNCMFLILLVLVQLPKKDAGAGMAFGAGTADALFGAGSGNALTKITKYTAVAFLALSLILGMLESHSGSDTSAADFTKRLEQKQQQAAMPTLPPAQKPQPSAPPAANGNNANNLLSLVPTNAPAQAPATTSQGK
jgi:preprotein translocase subunit SecG